MCANSEGRCAGSPEPWLVTYVISTIISRAGSNGLIKFAKAEKSTRHYWVNNIDLHTEVGCLTREAFAGFLQSGGVVQGVCAVWAERWHLCS